MLFTAGVEHLRRFGVGVASCAAEALPVERRHR